MILGTQKGPDDPCPRISGDAWGMILIFGAESHSTKFRSLINARRLLTRLMAAKNGLGEVDIELRRDGPVIEGESLRKYGPRVAGLSG